MDIKSGLELIDQQRISEIIFEENVNFRRR